MAKSVKERFLSLTLSSIHFKQYWQDYEETVLPKRTKHIAYIGLHNT